MSVIIVRACAMDVQKDNITSWMISFKYMSRLLLQKYY